MIINFNKNRTDKICSSVNYYCTKSQCTLNFFCFSYSQTYTRPIDIFCLFKMSIDMKKKPPLNTNRKKSFHNSIQLCMCIHRIMCNNGQKLKWGKGVSESASSNTTSANPLMALKCLSVPWILHYLIYFC